MRRADSTALHAGICLLITASFGACASATAGSRSAAIASSAGDDVGSRRFARPEELILADASDLKQREFPLQLKYPTAERQQGIEAGFYTVFVLDTSGRAEQRSITFGGNPPPAFAKAVCDHLLRSVRYQPILRAETPKRALVVLDWVFSLDGGSWRGRRYDTAPVRAAIQARGIPASVDLLESGTRC